MAAATGTADMTSALLRAKSSSKVAMAAASPPSSMKGTSSPAEKKPGAPEITTAPAPSARAASSASLSAARTFGRSALTGGCAI